MQQWTALGIVGFASLYLGRRFWRGYGAAAAAAFFLKRGQVGLAMRLKRQSSSGCSDCK